jgi:putative membrane protein
MENFEPSNAYCGSPAVPADILWRWNLDPWLLAFMALATLAWVTVAPKVHNQNPDIRFPLGVLAVAFVLFVSPLCALTSALFSARSFHHIILTCLLAPLLAACFRPKATPQAARTFLSAAGFAVVLWAWHVPSLYTWAASQAHMYWLMQLSLLAGSALVWRTAWAAPLHVGFASLLLTMMQMGLLGALLTFAPEALYAPHFATTWPWGFTALEDQQLGGLVMWVMGGAVYLLAALLLLRPLLTPAVVRT